MKYRHELACIAFSVLVLSACQRTEGPAPSPATGTTASSTPAPSPTVEKIEATPEAVRNAQENLQYLADRDRRMHAALSFEDFKASIYKEPFEGGKYIVNGDTPIANEKQLREFFELSVKPHQMAALILAQISGMDAKWNQQQKRQLTYCVSNTFGQRHAGVLQQMANATGEWEKVALVDFIHDAAQDGNCGPANAAVLFDVRPVNVNGNYLARAFFPNEPRAERNVLIDESSFTLPSSGKLQLAGILRHELGHTLGFRHEHTRPESGSCFEDTDWRPLTNYDAFSVMHYPQCNGKGDWSLNLTARDKSGVACLYGPNSSFTIDPALVTVADCAAAQPVPAPAGQPATQSFSAQTVAKGAQKNYGPFQVAGGSPLEVVIGGAGATGDPDLYVRFGAQPGVSQYDCRPFLDGPVEVCSLTVPATASRVFVMVRGYAKGTYDLRITRVPPGGAPSAVADGGTQ